VPIIFPSLMQEWRGDYVAMVLYLDDQHGILARRLPRSARKPLGGRLRDVAHEDRPGGTDRQRSPVCTTSSVHTEVS
jgi:hypothetical protein